MMEAEKEERREDGEWDGARRLERKSRVWQ